MYEDIEIMRHLLPRGLQHWKSANCTACHSHPFTGEPRAVAISPDGKRLATGDHILRIWDVHTGKLISGCPAATHNFASVPAIAEGVYLKGQGVVFTLTLPQLPPQPSAPKPTAKPLSDWERIRKQLRGEDAREPTPTTPKQPDLVETLLK